MKPTLPLMLCAGLALAGCGGQADLMHPTTWFSQGQPERLITLGEEAEDPRPLVQRVTFVTVERYSGGIIVRAKGLPPTQGWWDAELVQRPVEDGVLRLEFRLIPPPPDVPATAGPPRAREVTVAFSISDQGLRDKEITRIVVKSATNEMSARP